MSPKLWKLTVAVLAAAAVLEALQHLLMHTAPMGVYHAVSSALTLVLVALVAWQTDAHLRYLDAAARVDTLAQANEELRLALHELSRTEQLAAAGAAAAPLNEKLAELIEELPSPCIDPALLDDLHLVQQDLEALVRENRRTMRPVDLGHLAQWIADEIARSTAGRVTAVRPPEPVWVKANVARLEVALRHFAAHAVGDGAEDYLVVVVDTSDESASLTLAGPRHADARDDTLNWRIATAIVTECGGTLTITNEPSGVVYTLHLPLGPAPGRPRISAAAA